MIGALLERVVRALAEGSWELNDVWWPSLMLLWWAVLLAENRRGQAVQPVFELWEHRAHQDSSQQARPCSDPDGGWISGRAGLQLPEGAQADRGHYCYCFGRTSF